MTFAQKMKNRVGSKARFGPSRGPHLLSASVVDLSHQSSTSALPVRAWLITRQLSALALSFPQVLYATGTSFNSTPDSNVNEGMIATCCSISSEKGLISILSERQRGDELCSFVILVE